MVSSRSKNLIKYVIPTMLGSVSFFLFTIVDGIFVGQGVGTDALGAVNLMMPFVMVVNALFQLTTIGGVTVMAIRFGRKDNEGANQVFLHSLLGALVISLVLCLIGTCLTGPVCHLLGATITYHEMAVDYLFWYSLFIIPSALSTAFQGFLRNDGSPLLVSGAVVFGAILNIFGDWLLVFPLQMGLKGAAIATGVSQCVTLLILSFHFILKKGKLRIHRFKPQTALFKKIAIRGLPECIAQFATPVTTLLMNKVLITQVGDIAVNSYSIISYVASFSVAVFFGTSEGLQPLIGNCYGAKDTPDLKFYFHSGLIINFLGSALINVLLLIFGNHICLLFGADEATLAYTTQAMPIYALGFLVMAFNTMISSYFYSTKRSKQADVINVLRSFIINSIVILALPAIFGKEIIWYAFAIYEALVLVIAVILLKHSERNGIVYQ
ncbi:MAG: MATE family efflux transporter [Bacilli bacterium]